MKIGITPKLKSIYNLKKENRKHQLVSQKACVQLTQTEFDILKHCDGNKSLSTIVHYISLDYQGYPNYENIKNVIYIGYENGWLE